MLVGPRILPHARALRNNGEMATAAVLLALTAAMVAGAPPAHVDPSARYLFYVHGAIVEREGKAAVSEKYGRYDFDGVTRALADGGFEVVAPLRRPDSVEAHAAALAQMLRGMLAAGLAPDHLSVVGFSKGGAIALQAAQLLGEPRVTFVIMAGCFPGGIGDASRLRGRFLSIRDGSDDQSDSCAPVFAAAGKEVAHEEVTLSTGLQHGLFYAPRKEWTEPVMRFLQGKSARP